MSVDSMWVTPSEGLLKAQLGTDTVVYDAATETAHVLGPLGSWIVGLDGPTLIDDLVDDVVAATALSRPNAEVQIRNAVGTLRAQKLLDHHQSPEPVPLWPGSDLSPDGRATGRVHAIIDHWIAFRSSSRELLSEIDEFLGGGQLGDASIVLDAEPTADGRITLTAANVWPFDDRDGFFRQLVDVLNEYAARVESAVVLHAGAVRTPDGRVLVLAGAADVGKSTLTAALVQAGCDYLGDEVIGIRAGTLAAVGYPKPLSLDDSSRHVLGLPYSSRRHVDPRDLRSDVNLLSGDCTAVSEIILPVYRFDQGAVSVTRLDSVEAIRTLLSHTLNLERSGQDGLESLCRLAESVPVTRIEHDDAVETAAKLVATQLVVPVGRTVRDRNAIDGYRPTRASDVSLEAVVCDGHSATLLRPELGPTVVLDPIGSALWPLLDGKSSMTTLVESLAGLFEQQDDLWHLVIDQLRAMAKHDLINQPSAPWPLSGTRPSLAGPWQDSDAWLLANAQRAEPVHGGPGVGRLWAAGVPWATKWWGGVLVVTDSEALRDALTPAIDAGTAVASPYGAGEPSGPGEASIELREVRGPRGGAVLRVRGRHPRWLAAGQQIEVVATLLASMSGDPRLRESVPIAPVWARTRECRAALFVGALPSRHRTRPRNTLEGHWVRRSDMRIEDGRWIWVPDPKRAVSWLRHGAQPETASEIWSKHELTGLGVSGVTTSLDGWAKAADELAPSTVVPPSYLHHVVGGGVVPLPIGPALSVIADLHGTLGMSPGELRGELGLDSPQKTEWKPAGSALPRQRSGRRVGSLERRTVALERQWIDFGDVKWTDQSAKIDRHRIVAGRPLLRVRLASARAVGEGHSFQLRELVKAFVGFGLEARNARDAAEMAVKVGRFYVSEEWETESAWRRKIYINDFGSDDWDLLSLKWPAALTTRADPRPTWVAWKFTSRHPHHVVRAIDVPYLGRATTIADVTEPLLDLISVPWAEAVRAILNRIGMNGANTPGRDDALTIEENGRYSIDIAVRHGRSSPGGVATELRWLAAVAGHSSASSERLVEWVDEYYPANVIFGTDGSGEPFVNLYVSERSRS